MVMSAWYAVAPRVAGPVAWQWRDDYAAHVEHQVDAAAAAPLAASSAPMSTNQAGMATTDTPIHWVLLHGTPLSPAVWDAVRPQLAPQVVITPDLTAVPPDTVRWTQCQAQ